MAKKNLEELRKRADETLRESDKASEKYLEAEAKWMETIEYKVANLEAEKLQEAVDEAEKKRDEAEKKRDEAEAEWLDAINEADKIRGRCNTLGESDKANKKYLAADAKWMETIEYKVAKLEAEELQEALNEAEKKRDEAEKKRDEAEAEWLDAINEADKIRWRCNAARKSEKADEKYLEAEELQEALNEAEKKRDEAEAEWLDAINEADKIWWRCNAAYTRIWITRFDTKAGREAEWASIESEKADTEMLIATKELDVATGMMSEASKEEDVSLLADDIKHTNEMIENYIIELAERGFTRELAERGF